MAIRSFRSREFRRCLEALSEEIQTPEKFVLWSIHYRAIGHFVKDGFLWEWIGTHEEYNRLT